jgi:hypothetical protein
LKLDNLDKVDGIKTITLKAVGWFWKIIKESTSGEVQPEEYYLKVQAEE